jgi:putative transposase
MILDIFSRRMVGGCVAGTESASLFTPLLESAVERHAVPKDQLTLHADRGTSMKVKATALLADLGVTKSHSRPDTSDDNPFSETCFKTLKYQHQFPKQFRSIQDAKTFCRAFFDWYNRDHHHLGIDLMTPDQVHYGQTDELHTTRQKTLDQTFRANPNHFANKTPESPAKSTAVWINPPTQKPPSQAKSRRAAVSLSLTRFERDTCYACYLRIPLKTNRH